MEIDFIDIDEFDSLKNGDSNHSSQNNNKPPPSSSKSRRGTKEAIGA